MKCQFGELRQLSKFEIRDIKSSIKFDFTMKLENFYTPNQLLTEPKFGRPKRIKIWINGETYCTEFCVNPNNFRSWISILQHFTITIKPGFGSIRKLIELSSMKIIDCFEDLDPNEKYIALGASCRFKIPAGGYINTSEKDLLNRQKMKKRLYKGEINYRRSSFLTESQKRKLTLIYITVNGRNSQTPQKVVFKEEELKNWDLIFMYLSKILDVPEGVEGICTIFGDVLEYPLQLQHGFIYVAIPFKESFIEIDYLSLFKKHNNFRSKYTLSLRRRNDSPINRSSPRNKTSPLPTYRLEHLPFEVHPSYRTQNPSPRLPKVATIKKPSTYQEIQRRTQNVKYNDKNVRFITKEVKMIDGQIREEIAHSIKTFEQRIAKIENENLRKRKTYLKILRRSKQSCREEKQEPRYSSEVTRSITLNSGQLGSGDDKEIKTKPLDYSESARKISSDGNGLESTGSTITLKSTTTPRDEKIEFTSSTQTGQIKTIVEDFSKEEKIKEFSAQSNNIGRQKSAPIAVIEEVSEGALSETETKEILSPKNTIFSTSSGDKSADELQALFQKSSKNQVNSAEKEKISSECKSSYSDSLLDNSDSDSHRSDLFEDSVDNIDNTSTDKLADIFKDSVKNINYTTFGEVAGKFTENKHVNFMYSKPQGTRTASCPTITVSQTITPTRSLPTSFDKFAHKPIADYSLTPRAVSQTSSLDVLSGTNISSKSEETLKKFDKLDSGVVKGHSTGTFSVEKFIVKSEDVTMCAISSDPSKPTTMIILKEIERAEYSRVISSTKIVKVSDSLEVLPDDDADHSNVSCITNKQD